VDLLLQVDDGWLLD